MVPLLPAGWGYLAIIAPWLSYVLRKPVISSERWQPWAGDELKPWCALTQEADADWPCIAQLRFGGYLAVKSLMLTAVGLLAVSLMLALHVVPWKDITRYNSAWNTLVNPQRWLLWRMA